MKNKLAGRYIFIYAILQLQKMTGLVWSCRNEMAILHGKLYMMCSINEMVMLHGKLYMMCSINEMAMLHGKLYMMCSLNFIVDRSKTLFYKVEQVLS